MAYIQVMTQNCRPVLLKNPTTLVHIHIHQQPNKSHRCPVVECVPHSVLYEYLIYSTLYTAPYIQYLVYTEGTVGLLNKLLEICQGASCVAQGGGGTRGPEWGAEGGVFRRGPVARVFLVGVTVGGQGELRSRVRLYCGEFRQVLALYAIVEFFTHRRGGTCVKVASDWHPAELFYCNAFYTFSVLEGGAVLILRRFVSDVGRKYGSLQN